MAMNRRQFFGTVVGAAVVSKLPSAPAQPCGLMDIMQASYHLPQTAPTKLVTDGWAVVSDELHLYVSSSVEAADRLFDLHRAILGKEEA